MYDYDFEDFMRLMRETAKNLERMTEMQKEMHWQFGHPAEWIEFVKSVEGAEGWMNSHC